MNRWFFLLALFPSVAHGQSSTEDRRPGFVPRRIYISGLLGTGAIDRADVAFGARIEVALTEIRQAVVGVDLAVESWGFNGPHGTTTYDYSFTGVGATGSAHFGVKGSRLDPSIGLGLGFLAANSEYTELYGLDRSPGFYPIARAGLRVFISQYVAVGVDAGLGMSAARFLFTLRPTRGGGRLGPGGGSPSRSRAR